MSGPGPPYFPLPAAVTRETVNTTNTPSSNGSVKEFLLDLTSHITNIQSSTSMFGADPADRFSASVQTLYERLRAGHQAPFTGLTNEQFPERAKETSGGDIAVSVMQRRLEDFEDLYYALLAAVKSMHNTIILRLNNDFNKPNEPLSLTSGYTVHEFQEWLLRQWMLLNEPSLVLALDNAIRKSLVKDHDPNVALQMSNSGDSEQEIDNTDAALQCKNLVSLPGLHLIGHELPAMICGRLNEKYRLIFQAEKEIEKRQDRRGRKFGKMKKTAKDVSAQAFPQGSEHNMQLNWPPREMQQPVDAVENQHNMKHVTPMSQDHPQLGYGYEAEEWQRTLQSAAIHHPQHDHVSYQQENVFQTYLSVQDQGAFASLPLERQFALQQVANYTDWLRESASDDAKRLVSWPNQAQPSWNETSPYTFGYRNPDVHEEF